MGRPGNEWSSGEPQAGGAYQHAPTAGSSSAPAAAAWRTTTIARHRRKASLAPQMQRRCPASPAGSDAPARRRRRSPPRTPRPRSAPAASAPLQRPCRTPPPAQPPCAGPPAASASAAPNARRRPGPCGSTPPAGRSGVSDDMRTHTRRMRLLVGRARWLSEAHGIWHWNSNGRKGRGEGRVEPEVLLRKRRKEGRETGGASHPQPRLLCRRLLELGLRAARDKSCSFKRRHAAAPGK